MIGCHLTEKNQIEKNAQKNVTRLRRATKVSHCNCPEQTWFQNFIWPNIYLKKCFPRKFGLQHWVKNGSEDEWFFTCFNPPCPEESVPGPMGWVIWSTPGGTSNHPPRPLHRLTITILWPKRSSHTKMGSFFKSWIIGRGCNIWWRVTQGGDFICMYNISAK